MASSPFHVVETSRFKALFMLGVGDRVERIENVDAEITLLDGTRWSATFMTILEIERVMLHWAETGEYGDGAYFHCPDLVIIRDAGIPAMIKAIEAVLDNGGPKGILGDLN